MKVSIIGGGGLVGSCPAFALQDGGVVRELALLDVNAEMAANRLDIPSCRVLGLGTQLDTIRFRSLIAQEIAALWPKEMQGSRNSALVLCRTLDTVIG